LGSIKQYFFKILQTLFMVCDWGREIFLSYFYILSSLLDNHYADIFVGYELLHKCSNFRGRSHSPPTRS